MKVVLNKSNNNPFYGLKNCLSFFQNVGGTVTTSTLDACWNEVKDNKEHRELFFSLLFSVGDITARQHNIFKGIKKDAGGNANREGFYTIFNWLKDKHKEQFIKFLNAGLFNEYQCFDTLFRSRVQTKGTKVVKVYDIFADAWYRKELVTYVYSVINGTNPFNKMLVAKFLTIPRLSTRTGHKQMLAETKKIMQHKIEFLIELSKLMNWEYSVKDNYVNFKGYRAWRKEYNSSLESVLFSTEEIKKFDKTQFLDWFDRLPSQARFRVKNRILYSKIKDTEKLKWADYVPYIKEWETYKEKKQAEQRVLEEKVRQGQASNEDLVKLEKVKKQAKVTTGAINFKDLYDDICKAHVDSLKVEAFIQNKVNLPYNSLVIIDDSGSMTGAPFNFASFIAAVCLVKNPDDDARNLLGFFDSHTHWHTYVDAQASETPNYLFRRSVTRISPTPFVDPKKSFMENYNFIKSFCNAAFQGGGTRIDTIVDSLKTICNQYPEVLDSLKNYPVWTILSDGYFNSMPSPEASLNDMLRKSEQLLGFKPFLVIMDIGINSNSARIERFSGIDNVIYIPSNPAQIEQFLTNFKDMDVFDVYTPLQSVYRSNRYELVRQNTL